MNTALTLPLKDHWCSACESFCTLYQPRPPYSVPDSELEPEVCSECGGSWEDVFDTNDRESVERLTKLCAHGKERSQREAARKALWEILDGNVGWKG